MSKMSEINEINELTQNMWSDLNDKFGRIKNIVFIKALEYKDNLNRTPTKGKYNYNDDNQTCHSSLWA